MLVFRDGGIVCVFTAVSKEGLACFACVVVIVYVSSVYVQCWKSKPALQYASLMTSSTSKESRALNVSFAVSFVNEEAVC